MTRLTDEQLTLLEAVQRGLVEGWFADRAPLKYRSLQLTGDEKRLGRHLDTALFGEGRLTLDMLNCDGPWLPLAWERVGERPRLVIFENAGSFLVALRVLRALSDPPFGLVAYGAGLSVWKAVPYLDVLGRIEEGRYVGDLAPEGIRIGIGFARRVSESGGPPVLPATRLHRAMLVAAAELGQAEGWPADSERERSAPAEWFAPDVRDVADRMLAAGRRIPEEVLTERHLETVWGAGGP